MPAEFAKHGVRFQYPENWELTEDDGQEDSLTVTLQSPGSAFWSVRKLPPELDPQEVAEQVVVSMRTEYEEIEAAPLDEAIGSSPVCGFSMEFYCLDLLVTCEARLLTARGEPLLVIWQAEDREFVAMEPVFRAVTVSLTREDLPGDAPSSAAPSAARKAENPLEGDGLDVDGLDVDETGRQTDGGRGSRL